MKLIKTEIEGCYLVTYKTFHDERGYFGVPYNRDEFNNQIGYNVDFVQDNMSYSSKNVIRGLHFQTGEYEQAKLVTCTLGRVLDVVVDIRKNSRTYGKVIKVELGLGLERQLFIPRGCAHGFSVLSDKAIFASLLLDYNDKTDLPYLDSLIGDLYATDWDSFYYSTQSKNSAFIAFHKYLEKYNTILHLMPIWHLKVSIFEALE
jgi:dTDP-4-dehydrorhamnose 3,5-epimerase